MRRQAIANTLFRPTSLQKGIERLGFVQADPIRSPARAQDLILRHRVSEYRAGDLEKRYPFLDLEEDFLYAYGFMSRSIWHLLHPRSAEKLTPSEEQIVELVSSHKLMHPRELEAYFGREREMDAWGGYSKATTRTLQRLHYRGLLRIAKRENGIRLYEAAVAEIQHLDTEERIRQITMVIAGIFAPLPEVSLRSVVQHLARGAPDLPGRRTVVSSLVKDGVLAHSVVSNVKYVWPAGKLPCTQPRGIVRFLAPFDPLVWDRRRFEEFWGWAYRFEAYVPQRLRRLGYYAMPLMWRDDIIGWANITNVKAHFAIELGFAKERPLDPSFNIELEAEIARIRTFLDPADS
jgi:uncharacterized protein YcaQ